MPLPCQLTALLSVALLATLLTVQTVEGCSCPLRHPQQHFCEADFVANVKVRRVITLPGGQNVLKVRVRRLHKTNPIATAALSKKLIYTIPGTCSLNVTGRSMHVLTGDIQAGKPWTSACHFSAPWSSLAPRMKKGFRKLYDKGCDCPIMSCHWWESRCPTASFFCSWKTSAEEQDCQTQHGVCIRKPSGGGCNWLGGRMYRKCMSNWRTFKRSELPKHRQSNIATLIDYDDDSRQHSIDEITSNDVVPVVEDIQLPPTILNIKETSGRRHHTPATLDSRTTYSIGPRTSNSRFNKPRKPGSRSSATIHSNKPVKGRNLNSILGAIYSSRYSDRHAQNTGRIAQNTGRIAQNTGRVNHNRGRVNDNYGRITYNSDRITDNAGDEAYYSDKLNTVDNGIEISTEPIHYISNHIDELESEIRDNERNNDVETNIDFSKIVNRRRKYPEYTTRIGYIPD